MNSSLSLAVEPFLIICYLLLHTHVPSIAYYIIVNYFTCKVVKFAKGFTIFLHLCAHYFLGLHYKDT